MLLDELHPMLTSMVQSLSYYPSPSPLHGGMPKHEETESFRISMDQALFPRLISREQAEVATNPSLMLSSEQLDLFILPHIYLNKQQKLKGIKGRAFQNPHTITLLRQDDATTYMQMGEIMLRSLLSMSQEVLFQLIDIPTQSSAETFHGTTAVVHRNKQKGKKASDFQVAFQIRHHSES
jgi:hypothetical protein